MTLILLSFFSFYSFAQTYETLVEDIVFNSSSRTVITENQIQKLQSRDLKTLLATAANLSIISNSFQPPSISIRGGDSGHVLILIDGIPFYDPSTIQRTGNLSALNIKSIKRIEIIKGSQSVLYGGQALGGIIKIETIPLQDSQFITLETGSQSQRAVGAEYSKNHFFIQSFLKEKNVESPAKSSSKNYVTNEKQFDLGYQWQDQTEGFIKSTYLTDSSFSPSSDTNYQIVDVSNFKLANEQGFLSSHIKFKNTNGSPQLSFGIQKATRTFDFPLSSLNTFPIQENYKSYFHFFRLDFRPFKSDFMTLDLGLNYSYENFIFKDFNIKENDAFLEQRGVFTKITSLLDAQTVLSYGARVENWSGKNVVSVYQVGLSHKKSKFEISTGYKAPSLYQLKSSYGNPNLNEEQGAQINLTQDFEIDRKINFSMTVFYSRFKNLISTTGTFPQLRYINLNETETKGAEAYWTQEFKSGHSIMANLGYQEPKNLETNQWLPRRSLLNASLSTLLARHRHGGSAELLYRGPRNDNGPSGVTKLSGYLTANIGYHYAISLNDKIYFRLDNIGNNRYEETYGYFAEGLSALAGWSGHF